MNLTHLLDTDWMIRHFRGNAAYTRTILNIGSSHIAVSIVSIAEFYEGIVRSVDPIAKEQAFYRFLSDKTILPITDDICRLFGERRAQLRRANQLIGDLDLLIGVTCIYHDLTLLTSNRAHFERLPSLRVVSTPDP